MNNDELQVWTEGWEDKVYNDNGVNPDITLGEMLLLYFEWMSVHKVNCVVCLALNSRKILWDYPRIILGLS
jgi:hypothetical protein